MKSYPIMYVGMIIRKMVHLPTFALDLCFSPDPGN